MTLIFKGVFIYGVISFSLLVSGCKDIVSTTVSSIKEENTPVVVKRAVYFKLPLTQPDYHWAFYNREYFLDNVELTLDVFPSKEMKEKKYSFHIIQDGKIKKGWDPLSEENHKDDNEIYFGFSSEEQFEFTNDDYAKITFNVKNTLKGIGAEYSGNLQKGEYVTLGNFLIFDIEKYDAGVDEFVFLDKEQLRPTWDLSITSDKGWLVEE